MHSSSRFSSPSRLLVVRVGTMPSFRHTVVLAECFTALVPIVLATRQAPSFVHIGGVAFELGPGGEADVVRSTFGRRASTLNNVPNRTPGEFLIGTKPSFPFSYPAGSRNDAPVKFTTKAAGTTQYSGYSWELWDRFIFPLAAQRFGLNYSTYRIVHFDDNSQVLRAVADGLIDAGHAAITKTAARSDIVDFTTGWFDTGLAVCTRTVTGLPVDQAIETLRTVGGVVLNALAAVLVAVLVMAVAIFILERATPGPRPVMRRGCCAGIKDSAVLIMLLLAGVEIRMPSGPLSRPAAALCSVSSALMTIIVTAVATVALQSAASFLSVGGFSDLSGRTVIMPEATTAEAYVRTNGNGVTLRLTPTLDEAFEVFASGEGDAMVYDKPILTSFVQRDTQASGRARLAVVGEVFERQQYGIAMRKTLPPGVITTFNKAILSVYGTDEVAGIRDQWLSENPSAVSAASTSPESQTASVTEFLTNNFWAIAFLVSTVIGFAMAVGLIAFGIRSIRTLARQGQCNIRALCHFAATICSGEHHSAPSKRRRRASVAASHAGSAASAKGSVPASESGGSSGKPGRWCCCFGRDDRPPSGSTPASEPMRPVAGPLSGAFGLQHKTLESTHAGSFTSVGVAESPSARSSGAVGAATSASQLGWPSGGVAVTSGQRDRARIPHSSLSGVKESDSEDETAPKPKGGNDRDEWGKKLLRPPSARRLRTQPQGKPAAEGRSPRSVAPLDDHKASVVAAALAGMSTPVSKSGNAADETASRSQSPTKAERKAQRKAERKAAKRKAKEERDATARAARGAFGVDDVEGRPASPVLATGSRSKARSASIGPTSSPSQASGRSLLRDRSGGNSASSRRGTAPFASSGLDLTAREGRGRTATPSDSVAAAMGAGPDPWSGLVQAATLAIDGRPPSGGRPPAHGRTQSYADPSHSAAAHAGPSALVGVSPKDGASFHHPGLGSSGRASSLLDVASAAAAAEGHSVLGSPRGPAPPMARLGSGAPPASASGTVPGAALPELGIDPDERLFLKREQWRMMRSGRIAPVLPPNDLLWMIWERVDRLTQQALLQRAMGRLDVPADLEEVSPKTIDAEAKLLAEELQSRGLAAKPAMRAAMLAAMAGTAEAEDDEDEDDTSLSGSMPMPHEPISVGAAAGAAASGQRQTKKRKPGNMLAAAMAARRLRAGLVATRQRIRRQSMQDDGDDSDSDDGFDAGAFLASRRRPARKAPVQHHPATAPQVQQPQKAQRMALAPPPI